MVSTEIYSECSKMDLIGRFKTHVSNSRPDPARNIILYIFFNGAAI